MCQNTAGFEQKRRKTIVNMLRAGRTAEDIANLAESDIGYIEEVRKEMEL